jgi:hypothetical protein
MSIRLLTTGWLLVISPFIFPAHTSSALVPTEPTIVDNAYAMIEKGQSLLQEGDLVLRLNHDPASQFIKYFNRRDKSYSHAGIVLFENGYPYVYHIVNGDENPNKQIRKDSLFRFCNPRKNFGFGIYRYKIDSEEAGKLKAVLLDWRKKKIRFDHDFNLATDDLMYCSEMIAKALARATEKRIEIASTQPTAIEAGVLASGIHLPVSITRKLRLIAIDNLYMNAGCAPVFRYRF